MNTIDQVNSLLNRLIAEGVAKPEIIRQVAEACLEWPYVFGAWGEECTPNNRKRRARDEYPTIVSKCQVLSGKKTACHGCQWYPDDCRVRMYDCRGFTAWLVRQVGLDIAGQGATSQYNTASNWTQRGPIAEMPNVVCCVFKYNSSTKKYEHTGMHVGDGKIIHCSQNVQTGKTSDKGWTHYAIPVGLNDSEPVPGGKTMEIMYVTAQSGSTVRVREKPSQSARVVTTLKIGSEVLAGPSIDGWRQVISGGIGGYMMSVFLSEEPPSEVKYKITCYGMTWQQVQEIRKTCPTADVEKER